MEYINAIIGLLTAITALLAVLVPLAIRLMRNRREDRRERAEEKKAKLAADEARVKAEREDREAERERQAGREDMMRTLFENQQVVIGKLAAAIEASTAIDKQRNDIDQERDKTLVGQTTAINKVVMKADEGIAKIDANTQTVADLKTSVEKAATDQGKRLEQIIEKQMPHLSEQMSILSEQLKPFTEEFKSIRKSLKELLDSSVEAADQLEAQLTEMEIRLVKEFSRALAPTPSPPASSTISASSVPPSAALPTT